MIFLPIGRDDAEIRRHAYVSYAIIGLCIACFIAFNIAIIGAAERRLQAKLDDALEYLVEHPYLEVPPQLERFMPDQMVQQFDDIRRLGANRPALGTDRQQRELNALAEQIDRATAAHPFFKWGFVPKNATAVTLITSMFLHGDIWHLLGNLLFFFVTGPFLEDVFGRPAFAALYFSGGIVATLTHYAADTSSAVPLVGASGAIAAVMGASLLRFHKSRFEFILIPFWWRAQWHARFFLPAIVVLPLWFLSQLLLATLDSGGAGVAFWAHVGGFAYGVAFAALFAFLQIEAKFVNPVVEKATTWKVSDELLVAADARAVGNPERAAEILRDLLRREADNVEARRMAYDVAIETGALREAGNHAARLLDYYARRGESSLALGLIDEATDAVGDVLGEAFYHRAAVWLERSGERERAIRMYRLLTAASSGEATVRAMLRTAVLLQGVGELREAKSILEDVRKHPACTEEWKRAAAQQMAAVDAAARAKQT